MELKLLKFMAIADDASEKTDGKFLSFFKMIFF